MNTINPQHYKQHNIECIQITENMCFTLGNAFKYIWRMYDKGNALEDLNKALWYVERTLMNAEGYIDNKAEYRAKGSYQLLDSSKLSPAQFRILSALINLALDEAVRYIKEEILAYEKV